MTLEPLLFNMELMLIYSQILNDAACALQPREFSSLTNFARAIVRHFAAAAARNPLLYVESLFHVPARSHARFSETVTNVYTDTIGMGGRAKKGEEEEEEEEKEEARAHAQKERARKLKKKCASGGEEGDWDGSDSSESEVEFESDKESTDEASIGDTESEVESEPELGSDEEVNDAKLLVHATNIEKKKALKEDRDKKRAKKNEVKARKAWSGAEDSVLRTAFFKYPTAKLAVRAVVELPEMKRGFKSKKKIRERVEVLKLKIEYVKPKEKEEGAGGGGGGGDKENDRWSENRAYKSKRTAMEAIGAMEEEGGSGGGGGGKRLKKKGAGGGAEEDDDEDFMTTDNDNSTGVPVARKAVNAFLEDDDDE